MSAFKILTIDGGGMKGLYSATILHHLEKELREAHGEEVRLVDFTDMICGTSTGGLIALALSLRIPTETICSFYAQHGPRIFGQARSKWSFVRQVCFRGKFSDETFRSALEELFGDRKVGDSACLLCIPTYDYTHGTYGVFKFDHKEGALCRHNDISMVDVALATSAAPTFFPLAEISSLSETQYVDGGVWANNPALVGFAEAIWYFVGPGNAYDKVQLLSLASLNNVSGAPPLVRRERSFVDWAGELFDLGLIGQSEFTDVFLGLLDKKAWVPLDYTRIPSPAVSGRQVSFVKLDSADSKSIALFRQFGEEMYYRMRNNKGVRRFFGSKGTYDVDEGSGGSTMHDRRPTCD